MTEQLLRPRRDRGRKRTAVTARQKRTIIISAAAAGTVLLAGLGLHTHQSAVVESLKALTPVLEDDSRYDNSPASGLRGDTVFTGPEWQAHAVMVEAATASERLAQAEDVLDRASGVWLPWLSGDADAAAEEFLANDPATVREAEFRKVYDQTEAACQSPSAGIPTEMYISSWTAAGHPEATKFTSDAITPGHSDAVTEAAYKAAMTAGLVYLCPAQ